MNQILNRSQIVSNSQSACWLNPCYYSLFWLRLNLNTEVIENSSKHRKTNFRLIQNNHVHISNNKKAYIINHSYKEIMMRETAINAENNDQYSQNPTISRRNIKFTLKEPLLNYIENQKKKRIRICQGLKDLSTSNEDDIHKKRYKNKIADAIPLINPESKWLVIWNVLVLLGLLFNFFMAALVVTFREQAFQFDMNTDIGLALNGISLIILYLDLIVRFNIGFYVREKLITNRKLIFFHYFRYQFWIDTVTVISLTIYMSVNNYHFCYFKLAIYLRIYGMNQIDKAVQHGLFMYQYLLPFYRLIKMVILTWLITTWVACAFFVIDYNYYMDADCTYTQLGQLWLVTNGLSPSGLNIIQSYPQWFIWYEYSLYWSLQTSATTGYGNITAQNPSQVIYCNFVMLLMTVMFAYFINYVWSIIKDLNVDNDIDQKLVEVKRFWMQNLNSANKQLKCCQEKILEYVKVAIQDQQQNQIQQFILSNISNELKDEFYIQTKAKFVNNNAFLSQFLYSLPIEINNQMLKRLVYALQNCIYCKQQTIYQKGDYDPNLYYIKSGFVKLKIFQSPSDTRIRIEDYLSCDQIFGIDEYFTLKQRYHSACSVTLVKLWKLNYSQMRTIFKNQPAANQIFITFQSRVMINGQLSQILWNKCWYCQRFDHHCHQCKQICFQRQKINTKRTNKTLKNENIEELFQPQARKQLKRSSKMATKLIKPYRINKEVSVDLVKNYKYFNISHNIQIF